MNRKGIEEFLGRLFFLAGNVLEQQWVRAGGRGGGPGGWAVRSAAALRAISLRLRRDADDAPRVLDPGQSRAQRVSDNVVRLPRRDSVW